jgi:hypothetical protein
LRPGIKSCSSQGTNQASGENLAGLGKIIFFFRTCQPHSVKYFSYILLFPCKMSQKRVEKQTQKALLDAGENPGRAWRLAAACHDLAARVGIASTENASGGAQAPNLRHRDARFLKKDDYKEI